MSRQALGIGSELETEAGQLIAVVTGAGSGIGRAIAIALAKSNATLILVGRTLEKLQQVAECAGAKGARVTCCPADLSCSESLRNLADRLGKEIDGVDVLVHSAGTISIGPVESLPVEELDRQYRVNLRAPYYLTQALLSKLRSRHGQIVFINSTAGMVTTSNVSQYAATKSGLKAFADSLRSEMNVEGVRVLSVYPGRTATPMQAAVHKMEGRIYDADSLAQPDDIADIVIAALALPRSAEVTDVVVRPFCKQRSR